MALKVAIAAGSAAKAIFKPALLCRPWEVLAAHEAPRRSISSVSTCLGCVHETMCIRRTCIHAHMPYVFAPWPSCPSLQGMVSRGYSHLPFL
ncbi:isocitrate dehydrogenase 3 (NAD), gamma, isoform CRA_c [Rattus norvegicus]|uniref:Isocitrate dehydrogenase 3 (NAD), gamma, isoform CRA_c n=1 Tax=Rattus norvegicus TaxID=10116 RepID=A6KRV2_RAT|nr:isocitrate dehydrogenase 3 (NAD), gamma, isoform CRA_c [Rattus norvegicus]